MIAYPDLPWSCRPKRNGNTHAARVPRPPSTSGTISPASRSTTTAMILTRVVKRTSIDKRPCRWPACRRIRGACTRCTAMSGNGVKTTGTITTRALRPTALRGKAAMPARTVSCAAGPGPSTRTECGLRTASRPPSTSATAAMVFAVHEFGMSPAIRERNPACCVSTPANLRHAAHCLRCRPS